MPPSKIESILHEKAHLSITHADMDETSPLHLECKQDQTCGKNMNVLYKDEENGDQLRPGKLSFDNLKSQNQLKSSLTPLTFTSTVEGNTAIVLKSQTSRSSYAYDSSISSIDDTSIDHYLNKNHLMSVRTFRLQNPSKLVSNILKEGKQDNVHAEHQLNKIPLKSSTNSFEILDEGNARKLQYVSHNLAGHQKRASAESLPLSSQVELREPTFISNALKNQEQDRIELSSCNLYDIGKSQTGHDQCSSHPSHSFCCRRSLCSSCVYNIHHSSLIEEVRKLKMKDKRLHARRQCRPISNGAPFVICSQCFELLRLPMDFFVSKKGSNKIQCGSCSKIFMLQFPAKDRSISNKSVDAKSCPQVLQSSHSASNVSLTRNSSLVENYEEELLPTLHQLMGYYSATEVLYQVTDVDEGYESSEPAMPNSYRRYEDEKHKNLLLQYSEDETCYGCVEVEEVDSSKIANKRDRSRLRSLINGMKRIESWGSKA